MTVITTLGDQPAPFFPTIALFETDEELVELERVADACGFSIVGVHRHRLGDHTLQGDARYALRDIRAKRAQFVLRRIPLELGDLCWLNLLSATIRNAGGVLATQYGPFDKVFDGFTRDMLPASHFEGLRDAFLASRTNSAAQCSEGG